MSKGLTFKLLVGLAFIASAAAAFLFARNSFFADSRTPDQEFQDQLLREIRGPDLNANGIRDDVEQWIAQHVPEASLQRKAFLQLAADYQRVLVTTGNAQKSIDSLRALAGSLGCARYVLKSDTELEITRFKAVVLDTDARVRAWLKAYDRLKQAGIVAEPAPSASNCRFPL